MQTYNVGDVVAVLLNGRFRKGRVLLIAQSGLLVDVSGFHLGFNADDLQLWEDFLIECMSIEEQLPSELRLSSEQLELTANKMITKPFALSLSKCECGSTVRQAHSSPRTLSFYCALAIDKQLSDSVLELGDTVFSCGRKFVIDNEIPSWVIETIPLSVYSQDVQQNGYSTN